MFDASNIGTAYSLTLALSSCLLHQVLTGQELGRVRELPLREVKLIVPKREVAGQGLFVFFAALQRCLLFFRNTNQVH